MAIPGVTVPTKRVGKNNFEIRDDGFGTCTDQWVHNYRMQRYQRYIMYFIEARENPPAFEADGSLKEV